MPDIRELGRRVKAKYPNAYKDLSDEEVGRRVKAKYPREYADFADVKPMTLTEAARRVIARDPSVPSFPEGYQAPRRKQESPAQRLGRQAQEATQSLGEVIRPVTRVADAIIAGTPLGRDIARTQPGREALAQGIATQGVAGTVTAPASSLASVFNLFETPEGEFEPKWMSAINIAADLVPWGAVGAGARSAAKALKGALRAGDAAKVARILADNPEVKAAIESAVRFTPTPDPNYPAGEALDLVGMGRPKTPAQAIAGDAPRVAADVPTRTQPTAKVDATEQVAKPKEPWEMTREEIIETFREKIEYGPSYDRSLATSVGDLLDALDKGDKKSAEYFGRIVNLRSKKWTLDEFNAADGAARAKHSAETAAAEEAQAARRNAEAARKALSSKPEMESMIRAALRDDPEWQALSKEASEIKSSVIESSAALKRMGRGTKKRAAAEAEHSALLDKAEGQMSRIEAEQKRVQARVQSDVKAQLERQVANLDANVSNVASKDVQVGQGARGRVAKVAYVVDPEGGEIARRANYPIPDALSRAVHPDSKASINLRTVEFSEKARKEMGVSGDPLGYVVESTKGNSRISVTALNDGTIVQVAIEMYDAGAPAGSRWKRVSKSKFAQEWLNAHGLELGDSTAFGQQKVIYKTSPTAGKQEYTVPGRRDVIDPDGEYLGFNLDDDVSNITDISSTGNSAQVSKSTQKAPDVDVSKPGAPKPEAHYYRTYRRPPGNATVPELAEVVRASGPDAYVRTNRRLTVDEMRDFDLVPVSESVAKAAVVRFDGPWDDFRRSFPGARASKSGSVEPSDWDDVFDQAYNPQSALLQERRSAAAKTAESLLRAQMDASNAEKLRYLPRNLQTQETQALAEWGLSQRKALADARAEFIRAHGATPEEMNPVAAKQYGKRIDDSDTNALTEYAQSAINASKAKRSAQDEFDAWRKKAGKNASIEKQQRKLDELKSKYEIAEEGPVQKATPESGRTQQATSGSATQDSRRGATPKRRPEDKPPIPTGINKADRVAPRKSPEVTGAANAITDLERAMRGRVEVSKADYTGVKESFDLGKKAIDEKRIDPIALAEEVSAKPRPITKEEVGALTAGRAKLIGDQNDLFKRLESASDEEGAAISEQIRAIDRLIDRNDEALQRAGREQSEAFNARRMLVRDDMTFAGLRARGRTANMGRKLSAASEQLFKDLSEKYESALGEIKGLKGELEEAYKKLAASAKAIGAKGSPMRQRATALARLNRAGVKTVGGKEVKIGSKQAGAIDIPLGEESRIARDIRLVAKTFIMDGSATTLDEVVDKLKEVIPGLTDEQALGFLSNKIRTKVVEADIAKRQAARHMNELKKAADFRLLSRGKKIGAVAMEIVNFLGRNVKAGVDLSAPFIQGRTGIGGKPDAWVKSWAPMLRALTAKNSDEFMARMESEMAQHPLYARAIQAKLSLPEPGMGFSAAEETFAGNLTREIARIKGLGIIAKPIIRTENAYTAFLNKLRFDWFTKLAAIGPDDPEYLRDIAQMINIATGRGEGVVAQLASNPIAGQAFFAPRYTVSQWQLAALKPIYSAKTKEGAKQAMKMYAGNALAIGGVAALATWFGWKVETDSRSSEFGMMTRPDGQQFDLFNKQAQPVRLIAQSLWGSVGKTGEYREPDPASTIGRYFTNKAAPLPGALWRSASPKSPNEDGEWKPMTKEQFALQLFLPLSLGEAFKNNVAPDAKALAIFGMGTARKVEPKKKVKPAPPMKPLLPGWDSLFRPQSSP